MNVSGSMQGINRVILATDGDFNVGVPSRSEWVELIKEKRETGVFLTVLGVGRDGHGERAEFIQLVSPARNLVGPESPVPVGGDRG